MMKNMDDPNETDFKVGWDEIPILKCKSLTS